MWVCDSMPNAVLTTQEYALRRRVATYKSKEHPRWKCGCDADTFRTQRLRCTCHELRMKVMCYATCSHWDRWSGKNDRNILLTSIFFDPGARQPENGNSVLRCSQQKSLGDVTEAQVSTEHISFARIDVKLFAHSVLIFFPSTTPR